MIEVKDIYYSAGLLEGEGCFRLSHGSPEISINMTDFEPIYNLKQIMSPLSTIRLHRNKSLVTINNKDVWHLAICGQLAIEWMMTLYPLMCPRRQEKIREIIYVWKNKTNKQAHSLSISNRKKYMRIV